ncbi:MAG: hypothetical protein ABI895_11205 [Deltaproteobacteria bacterium]
MSHEEMSREEMSREETSREEALSAADSDFAPAGSSEEDEDVSLDELMMSDSLDEDDDEDEATDIHPGLSDALLAESLRGARSPLPEALRPEAPLPQAVSPQAVSPQAVSPQAVSPQAVSSGEGADGALELPLEDDSSPDFERVASSYPELEPASSVASLAADAEAAQAEAEAAQAEAAGDDEPVERASAQEESSVDVELPVELEQEEISAADAAAEPLDDLAPEAASQPDVLQTPSAPESAPLHAEPPRSDAAPAEVIELAPESEAEVLSSSMIESVGFEAEAAPEAEERSVPADLDLDDDIHTAEPSARVAPATAERQTMPDTLAAKRRDAPLPSFDIPDLEAMSAASTAASTSAGEPRSRVSTRPVALTPLSEIAEDDDDDAVTHMGLPAVPEAANDFRAPGGFQVADPAVAALESLDADISQGNPRRATTRVIPRIDPKSIPVKPRVYAPVGPPLAERLESLARGAWARVVSFTQSGSAEVTPDAELSPARRRFSWLKENVLPPLSLVLFGSGLGASGILLIEPDRGSDASATQTVQALQEATPRGPLTLADRARAGDGEALYKITNLQQAERTSALTLALEAGYQAQKLREFREFAKSLTGSGPVPAASVSRMVDYATSPETMLLAFQELTQWAGAAGPDVLYAVWEKAAGGSRAASLAQQLLYSADQRAKASAALVVALDLRSAANCDDYSRVLPAVVRNGDQRSSATLRALRHNDGCGADGQQDCYACLRDNSLLEDALKAIDAR